MTHHPRRNDAGQFVTITEPSSPTALTTWADPHAVAVVVPDGRMPAELNGLQIAQWGSAPQVTAGWEHLASETAVTEPVFQVPAGFKAAAGVVVVEPDGRVWLVCPTNRFGGAVATFPKGRPEGKSTQATALVETFEESGLHVRITRFLVDVRRSTTYTRYFLGVRVGGTPADMGWESQAVMLVPQQSLTTILTSPYEKPILEALAAVQAP